jgi:hypothetical protein
VEQQIKSIATFGGMTKRKIGFTKQPTFLSKRLGFVGFLFFIF